MSRHTRTALPPEEGRLRRGTF
ncbi:MAG: hypothetical protein QOK44_5748, partial [Betaproteobacteria bacterium]|nr:hypothetical protein [Betaproteobacteria bacterium]